MNAKENSARCRHKKIINSMHSSKFKKQAFPCLYTVFHFYRAMLCIRGTSHGPVSVRPTQVGVLLKRLNIGSHKQHHTIAQGLQFSDAQDLREIRPWSPLTGHQMQVGWVKIGDFPQITGYISKTVQDRRMVSFKVEQEVVCALSNGDIADDLECPLTVPNYPIFCILHRHSQRRNG